MRHVLALIIFSVSLLCTFSIEGTEAKPLQERWDDLATEVDTWVDGMGYPIDPNIKETVIGLNALGFVTSASCEGHMDHGTAYPWIRFDLNSPALQQCYDRLTKIQNEIQEEIQQIQIKHTELSSNAIWDLPEAKIEELTRLNKSSHEISNEIAKEQQKSIFKLTLLLKSFYDYHTSAYGNILYLNRDIYNCACIMSLGGDQQILRSETDKEIKLVEYQEEMQKFGAFLKNRFLNQTTLQ